MHGMKNANRMSQEMQKMLQICTGCKGLALLLKDTLALVTELQMQLIFLSSNVEAKVSVKICTFYQQLIAIKLNEIFTFCFKDANQPKELRRYQLCFSEVIVILKKLA